MFQSTCLLCHCNLKIIFNSAIEDILIRDCIICTLQAPERVEASVAGGRQNRKGMQRPISSACQDDRHSTALGREGIPQPDFSFPFFSFWAMIYRTLRSPSPDLPANLVTYPDKYHFTVSQGSLCLVGVTSC